MAFELQIYSPTAEQKFASIKWNHEQLKTEIAEAMAGYQNLVVSPGTEAESKDLRAKMNKLRTALETARKDLKRRASEPIKVFENQVKEVEQPIDKAIENLDKQLNEIAEQKKAVKRKEIEESFLQITGRPDWLKLEQIWNEKWLNASYYSSTVIKDMQGIVDGVNRNLAVIWSMPEISFEAERFYSETLDFGGSIKRAKDALELQKQKEQAEAERQRKAEEEKQKQEQTAQFEQGIEQARQAANFTEAIPQTGVKQEESTPQEKIYTVSFRVELTRAQAKALGDFCRANGIMLEKI